MEIARDEVRVMTVHGAKGLEAPIVILADTTTIPDGPHPPRLLKLPCPARPMRRSLVWAKAKAPTCPAAAAARERACRPREDEYRRLLYVAMTRAADRLIVCGAVGEQTAGGLLVRPCARCPRADRRQGADRRRRPRAASARGERRSRMAIGTVAPSTAALPPMAGRNVEARGDQAGAAQPDRADRGPSAPLAGADDRRRASRGTLVHRLMQSLPDVPAERRAMRPGAISNAPADFTEDERDHLPARCWPCSTIRGLRR